VIDWSVGSVDNLDRSIDAEMMTALWTICVHTTKTSTPKRATDTEAKRAKPKIGF
jgi:hypothetical protein